LTSFEKLKARYLSYPYYFVMDKLNLELNWPAT